MPVPDQDDGEVRVTLGADQEEGEVGVPVAVHPLGDDQEEGEDGVPVPVHSGADQAEGGVAVPVPDGGRRRSVPMSCLRLAFTSRGHCATTCA